MGLQNCMHRGDSNETSPRTTVARRASWLRTLMFVGVSFMAWPSGASAAAAEFKCYVIADGSAAHLRLLESTDLMQAQLAAGQPWKQSKKRVLGISQVVECQPAQSSFVNPAARLLDERTPR